MSWAQYEMAKQGPIVWFSSAENQVAMIQMFYIFVCFFSNVTFRCKQDIVCIGDESAYNQLMVVVLILYWAICMLTFNTTNMTRPPTWISLQQLSNRHWTNRNLHFHVTLSCHATLKWKLDFCCSFYCKLFILYIAEMEFYFFLCGRIWSDPWGWVKWSSFTSTMLPYGNTEVLFYKHFLDCLF